MMQVNYLVQMYVTFIKKDEGKQPVLRRLLETSQVMYWFGIACNNSSYSAIFSFVPPFFYGAFNAVMAYITLVIVIIFHLSCFTTRKIKNRHVWSLMHFFYHLAVFVWILIGMILGFMWSESVYSYQAI